VKFGYDKRKAHLASLVVTGEITRDDALRELEKPLYTDNELSEDKAFVAKKLGISWRSSNQLTAAPPKHYSDYPNHQQQLKMLYGADRLLARVRSRAGQLWATEILPTSSAGAREQGRRRSQGVKRRRRMNQRTLTRGRLTNGALLSTIAAPFRAVMRHRSLLLKMVGSTSAPPTRGSLFAQLLGGARPALMLSMYALTYAVIFGCA
jgi:hypothetical protein